MKEYFTWILATSQTVKEEHHNNILVFIEKVRNKLKHFKYVNVAKNEIAPPFRLHAVQSISDSKCIVPLQLCTSIIQKSSPGGRFIGAAPETPPIF